jgi:polar amino acid transport system substrate-binding protein
MIRLRSGRSRPAVAVILGLAVAGAGCEAGGDAGGGAAFRRSALDRVLETRILKVGMNPGYAPFEMVDRDGALIGFDVDVATWLARQIGDDVKVVIQKSDWDPIIANLNADKFDLILSGMTRTPQRALRCAFTDPYFTTGQALLVSRARHREGGAFRHDAFDRPGIVVATKLGTTGEIAARKHFTRATIKTMETETDAALEVEAGRADLMVYDQPYIAIRARQTRERCFAYLEPFTKEHLAIAVRRDDIEFRDWLNLALSDLRESGTWDSLYAKWFVAMPWLERVDTPAAPAVSP